MSTRRSTATIVSTGIVGSVAPPVYELVLRRIIEGHGGRLAPSDEASLVAAFDAVSSGLAAAIELQRRVTTELADVQLCIGVATGDVNHDDGDCYGAPVIAAAGLRERAAPGQILTTGLVCALAGDRRASVVAVSSGHDELVDVHEVHWELADGDRHAAWPFPPMLATRSRFGFVGRASELDALGAAWATARDDAERDRARRR